jgi:hypothetical protein
VAGLYGVQPEPAGAHPWVFENFAPDILNGKWFSYRCYFVVGKYTTNPLSMPTMNVGTGMLIRMVWACPKPLRRQYTGPYFPKLAYFPVVSRLGAEVTELKRAVIIKKEKDIQKEHDLPKLIKRLSLLQKRVIMLMCASAIERYEHFVATYPDIAQRVPQKMITSYLGITPEALSTVRRKRIEKK